MTVYSIKWVQTFRRHVLPLSLKWKFFLESGCPCQTLLPTYQAARCQDPENSNVNFHRLENISLLHILRIFSRDQAEGWATEESWFDSRNERTYFFPTESGPAPDYPSLVLKVLRPRSLGIVRPGLGAIPSLLHTFSCRGVVIRHRGNIAL
jgi:hypothetical protein